MDVQNVQQFRTLIKDTDPSCAISCYLKVIPSSSVEWRTGRWSHGSRDIHLYSWKVFSCSCCRFASGVYSPTCPRALGPAFRSSTILQTLSPLRGAVGSRKGNRLCYNYPSANCRCCSALHNNNNSNPPFLTCFICRNTHWSNKTRLKHRQPKCRFSYFSKISLGILYWNNQKKNKKIISTTH